MEKKIYEKPAMQLEEFIPNECVATCGQTVDGKYLFACDAGTKNGHNYAYGDIYLDNGNGTFDYDSWNETVDEGWGNHKGGFEACDKTHTTSSMNDFKTGWFVPCNWSRRRGCYDQQYDKVFKVLVWLGEDGQQLHCTENLDREHYQEPKS